MRTFWGIPIPATLAQEIHDRTVALRAGSEDVKWVKPANYHITLLFLGEIDEGEISRVTELVDKIGLRGGSVASLGGIGRFPAKGAPRVVYAGLREGIEWCVSVHGVVCTALHEYAERRGYVPHITLGRVKRGRRVVLASEITLPADPFRLEEIVLYHSVLTAAGAEYRRLHSVAL